MHTIRIRVHDKVYKNLIKLLGGFSKDEIQIIDEDETYISIKQYLEKELLSIEDGSAEYIDITELQNQLEETIRKHEA